MRLCSGILEIYLGEVLLAKHKGTISFRFLSFIFGASMKAWPNVKESSHPFPVPGNGTAPLRCAN